MIKYIKNKKVSLIIGTLILVTQAFIILGKVPSLDVQGEDVLTANSYAVIDMAIN